MACDLVMRRYTFKLYPNTAQRGALEEQSRMMAQLWNALLQRREDVYRRERRTLSNYEMKKEITTLRAECPEWQSISVAAARGVADHLDEAFKAFFKRAKRGDGASSGYPRYKRVADGMSISFSEKMGSGWSLKSAQEIAERSAMGRFTACRNGKSPKYDSVLTDVGAQAPSKTAVAETGLPIDGRAGRAQAPSKTAVAETGRLVSFRGARAQAPSKTAVAETAHDRGSLRWRAQAPSKTEVAETKNWRVYAKGVPGMIKARGTFPAKPEEYRTGEIIKRDGAWYLSIVVKMQPRRSAGAERLKITFDLIDEFARVERAKGQSLACSSEQITAHSQHDDAGPGSGTADLGGDENRMILCSWLGQGSGTADLGGDENKVLGPVEIIMARVAMLGERADAIKSEGDRRYRKFSWRWKRAKRQIAAIQGRQARIRRHHLHVWSTNIVSIAADVTVIKPAVKEQTASARGDEREWGANVDAVAGLNRNTLNQAPAMAVQMLAYKAAEAGIRCDVIEDAAPKIAIGGKLVAAGKAVRKSKRAIRKQSQ